RERPKTPPPPRQGGRPPELRQGLPPKPTASSVRRDCKAQLRDPGRRRAARPPRLPAPALTCGYTRSTRSRVAAGAAGPGCRRPSSLPVRRAAKRFGAATELLLTDRAGPNSIPQRRRHPTPARHTESHFANDQEPPPAS